MISGSGATPASGARSGRGAITRQGVRAAAGMIGAWMLVLVAGLLVLVAVAPSTTGPLALVQVLAQLIALASIVAGAVLAAVLRGRPLVIALAILLGVSGVRFGSEWISLPASAGPGEVTLHAMTWNIEVGASSAAEIVEPILASGSDIVGLQEVTADAAAFLEADPRIAARYPHRRFAPAAFTRGLAILSAYPILDDESRDEPLGMRATIETPGGRIEVLVVHPLPGRIDIAPALALPVGFDARERDARLAGVRHWIDEILGHDPTARLVVLGDLNVTPTEPAYGPVADGLLDAHRDVGFGPGWTWRPGLFEGLGTGLLRIDYVLSSPPVRPATSSIDCHVTSDHCALRVELSLPAP